MDEKKVYLIGLCALFFCLGLLIASIGLTYVNREVYKQNIQYYGDLIDISNKYIDCKNGQFSGMYAEITNDDFRLPNFTFNQT